MLTGGSVRGKVTRAPRNCKHKDFIFFNCDLFPGLSFMVLNSLHILKLFFVSTKYLKYKHYVCFFSLCKVCERDYSLCMKKTWWGACGKDGVFAGLGIQLLSGVEISKRKLVSMIVIVNSCWVLTRCQARYVLSTLLRTEPPSEPVGASDTTTERGRCLWALQRGEVPVGMRVKVLEAVWSETPCRQGLSKKTSDKTVMTECWSYEVKNKIKVTLGV